MEKQDVKENIAQRMDELRQTGTLKNQLLKAELAQKLVEVQAFAEQLQRTKMTLDALLNQHQSLLAELDEPLDLSQEAEEFERQIAQDDLDLNKFNEEYPHILQEAVNAKMNEIKVKVLTAQQSVEEKLAEAKAALSGKPSKMAQYKAKLLCGFNAKFGDKLQKAKHILANQLEQCAVKLKA